MKENESVLYSQYIIDGIRCNATPAELLEECMEYDESAHPASGQFEDIIDESTEPPLSSYSYDRNLFKEYAEQVKESATGDRAFTMLYPDHFTRLQIAKSLLSRLWSEGHFKLGDLRIWAQWEWNTRPIGNLAAFYESARSASEYIYGLGVKLEDYLVIEGDCESNVKFFSWLPETPMTEEFTEEDDHEETLFKSSPYESSHPWINEARRCLGTLEADPDSWIIFIPFDTCAFKTGGTLLARVCSDNGGQASGILDPDYFIDCYEVVKELTEDGIIISGQVAADGGLATAALRMCGSCGLDMDISGLMSAYQEKDAVKILFGEVPGVLIQISDENYDYVDSQFLLQDIAYYPIGHPSLKHNGVELLESTKSGVADILASLLGQASEGED